jgi:hypothetical protein
VVDEDAGPFQIPIGMSSSEDESVMAQGSGVQLHQAPPKRGEKSEDESPNDLPEISSPEVVAGIPNQQGNNTDLEEGKNLRRRGQSGGTTL